MARKSTKKISRESRSEEIQGTEGRPKRQRNRRGLGEVNLTPPESSASSQASIYILTHWIPAIQAFQLTMNVQSNLDFASVVARQAQAQMSIETTTASEMAGSQNTSIEEKIEKIREKSHECGTPEVLELIIREIRALRREYDQVDARLALMESWIHFENTQTKNETEESLAQDQGQSDHQDAGREDDSLVDPSLCLDQVNKAEDFGLEQ
ncbi:hypothetical protein N7541_010170 [Penicillium brevicompactum]|uniref:Uncharacterized protein n=1 Tax=Penicillium brevicompactum TaxID=5074 RepID=A0A9W9UJL9_PENBR|nr:hypothetical protein N7541_010170 [Penicillium brevicompactum]